MRLVVFDLDGTLIDINPIDDEAFVTAFREELGIDCTRTDWSQFEFVTNSGIAGALLESVEEHSRASALQRVRQRFVEILERESSEASRAFRPISGAASFIIGLPRTEWRGVIATGCWRASVHVKLRSAGLAGLLPFVSSDDDRSREGIVRRAIALAREQYGSQFDRVVMIGDAPWDVRAAAKLGLPFVGVADGPRSKLLHILGVTHIVRDYGDVGEVMAAFESACLPAADVPFT